MSSYKPLLRLRGESGWASNALRFATAAEALSWATETQQVWRGCRPDPQDRSVEWTSAPARHRWRPGVGLTELRSTNGPKDDRKTVKIRSCEEREQ